MHVGLPSTSPLNEALVGLELLLARLYTWQETVASEREGTSFSPEISPLSGLVARWRRLQSASWGHVIEAAVDGERERVAESWHHLFKLISGAADPKTAVQVVTVAEEFLQSATLGQFAARLEMLRIFSAHCKIVGGGLWPVAVWLANVAAYYGQHLPAVEADLRASLAPIRKALAVCSFCQFFLAFRWFMLIRIGRYAM
jgi:midasin